MTEPDDQTAGQRAEQSAGEAVEPDADEATDDSDGIDPTGVPVADEAAARLQRLKDAPLGEHVEIYEDAHQRLQDGLADLDERAP